MPGIEHPRSRRTGGHRHARCSGVRRRDPGVVVTGGRVTVEEDAARVEATKCVVLLTRMDGSSTPVDAKALSEALLAEYDELLARHAPVHGELYDPGRNST